LEGFVAAVRGGGGSRGREVEVDVLVLQPAQALVGIGDIVERLHHFGLELSLNGRKRERVLHIIVVEFSLARWALAHFAILRISARQRRLEGSWGRGRGWRRRRLRKRRHPGYRLQANGPPIRTDDWARYGYGIGPRIGGFQIDDVTQKDFSFVQLIAPDDDGLERERALA